MRREKAKFTEATGGSCDCEGGGLPVVVAVPDAEDDCEGDAVEDADEDMVAVSVGLLLGSGLGWDE